MYIFTRKYEEPVVVLACESQVPCILEQLLRLNYVLVSVLQMICDFDTHAEQMA